MSQTITIATFNCENLFTRFKFGTNATPAEVENAVKNGFIIEKKLFETIMNGEKKLTAAAIKETKADIIGLQEVENLDTLKAFQSEYLKLYPYQYLIDGNDPRLIDVGVLSKLEATHLLTHQFDKKGKTKVFSRDCLEIEYMVDKTPLTIFVNHFKSMLGGREETMPRRKNQAERVVEIIKNKFGSKPEKENFIVMGDLNDYMPSKGIDALLKQPWLENVIAKRLPKAEQWTHWWDKNNSIEQLDYLLLSKRLATNSKLAKPNIIRKGLAKKASKVYDGVRFAGATDDKQAASDHCPIAMQVTVK